ncbi:predicted protein [Sclerotinia sclerotiorum 1980 UF-70]|uniref:Uncharacterized protein n=1 Tax=Sclerotinia sclerotiorum (strain ATCC 18683 / 1980 / Ss-1) TaxID=665079 RepID=A7EJD8_SCLS1|nr:predicted protein [Sclerotinia sclerotiorum 1980 UF-70]EDO02954.1 predicted protein [Sclerotinia sclerotiorum 1980 UF-70]
MSTVGCLGVGDQRESTKEILVGYQSNTCCHKLGVGLLSGTVTSDAPNLAQIIILDGWDDPDDRLASYWPTGFSPPFGIARPVLRARCGRAGTAVDEF